MEVEMRKQVSETLEKHDLLGRHVMDWRRQKKVLRDSEMPGLCDEELGEEVQLGQRTEL